MYIFEKVRKTGINKVLIVDCNIWCFVMNQYTIVEWLCVFFGICTNL